MYYVVYINILKRIRCLQGRNMIVTGNYFFKFLKRFQNNEENCELNRFLFKF